MAKNTSHKASHWRWYDWMGRREGRGTFPLSTIHHLYTYSYFNQKPGEYLLNHVVSASHAASSRVMIGLFRQSLGVLLAVFQLKMHVQVGWSWQRHPVMDTGYHGEEDHISNLKTSPQRSTATSVCWELATDSSPSLSLFAQSQQLPPANTRSSGLCIARVRDSSSKQKHGGQWFIGVQERIWYR